MKEETPKESAKNNIIEDWLKEHGDPEVDKEVERKLEQITLKEAADSNPRYIILEESCSGHCCFEYTVIDTHIEDDVTWKRSMCETFDKDKAETICNALNRL
jgi:hypothetical protein